MPSTCHDCGQPLIATDGGKSRCLQCQAARRDADRRYRREIADAVLPAATRAGLLILLRSGQPFAGACADVGISPQLAHGYRRYNPQWAKELDKALLAGRDPSLDHGSEYAYRIGRCRCPDCRTGRRARENKRRQPQQPTTDDGMVECRLCQRRLRTLYDHIARVHGLDAATYRARFGLSAREPLEGAASRRVAIRDARRDGVPAAREAWSRRFAEHRERLALRAGFESWDDLIRGTSQMRKKDVAALTGMSVYSIKQWRVRILGPGPNAQHLPKVWKQSATRHATERDKRAVAAGYASWDDLIRSTAHLTAYNVARITGIPYSTIYTGRVRQFGEAAAKDKRPARRTADTQPRQDIHP